MEGRSLHTQNASLLPFTHWARANDVWKILSFIWWFKARSREWKKKRVKLLSKTKVINWVLNQCERKLGTMCTLTQEDCLLVTQPTLVIVLEMAWAMVVSFSSETFPRGRQHVSKLKSPEKKMEESRTEMKVALRHNKTKNATHWKKGWRRSQHKILFSYLFVEWLHCTRQDSPTPAQEVVLNSNFLLCSRDHCCP